jgi:CubicO group peptidase (beta-lactamase class C family)
MPDTTDAPATTTARVVQRHSLPVRYALADAKAFGIDTARIDELRRRAHREIDEGSLPSCQLALARNGRLLLDETIGDAAPNSRYLVFSATKGVIAGAIWLLVGERALHWSDRVTTFMPEFAANGKGAVTVEQLLTHTSGFPTAPFNPLDATTSAARAKRFEEWKLNWEPGTRFEYHPTSAHWVLAEIITRASGTDYREFVRTRLFEPLGLSRFALGEPPERQADVNDVVATGEVPTPEDFEEQLGVRINLADYLGEVTQENLLQFNRADVRAVGVPGAGGISTAADIALYYQGILHNRDRLWDPAVIKAGTDVAIDLPDPIFGRPAHRSRGLVVAGDPPAAQFRGFGLGASPRTFGHNGAGGQVAWVDPASGISFCYLTNGLDADPIRVAKRGIGLSSRASACAIG